MRAATFLLAVAVAAGVPATAQAQNTTTTAPAPVYTTNDSTGQWFASGFIGSNFNASLDNDIDITNFDANASSSSLEFGGNIGYTWNRVFGVEFLADFTPTFGVRDVLDAADVSLLVDDPRLNTYMFNAIAAIPIGAGRFSPYVSGGLGSMSLAADVRDSVLDLDSSTRVSRSRMGTNFGGGVYTFAGDIGFRADVRHYNSSADDNRTAVLVADRLTENLVSGLSFWRANVGIAFRW